ncbi:VOC family protein [Citricoccus zhacaiensis]|nr:VOC family protein [Citricoccus zhacaiensis]
MINGFYPVLVTEDVPGAAGFFRDHFGFETTFEAEWYVSLRRDSHEIAVLAAGHPTLPEAYRQATTAGLLINIEVEDVDATYQRLVQDRSLPLELDIRSEDFGQRHFILEGPGRILIDVIAPIPPSEDFAAAYSASDDQVG